MDFNLKCDKFKDNIFNLINQSELPIAVIYYIYKDIFNQVQKAYIGAINSAIIQKQKQSPDQNKGQIKTTNEQKQYSIDLNDFADKDK